MQRRVASAPAAPLGHLLMTVKSAHIYATEAPAMTSLVSAHLER